MEKGAESTSISCETSKKLTFIDIHDEDEEKSAGSLYRHIFPLFHPHVELRRENCAIGRKENIFFTPANEIDVKKESKHLSKGKAE